MQFFLVPSKLISSNSHHHHLHRGIQTNKETNNPFSLLLFFFATLVLRCDCVLSVPFTIHPSIVVVYVSVLCVMMSHEFRFLSISIHFVSKRSYGFLQTFKLLRHSLYVAHVNVVCLRWWCICGRIVWLYSMI